jgi:Lrp/AsnC family leucine-responsive transcriptional regulator
VPLELDRIDSAILKSLMENGRKSFRQISREVGVSTPTVKARYERMVNLGLIKAVIPIINKNKLHIERIGNFELLVKVNCDYCKDKIAGRPAIFKFGNIERFFCCSSCKALYKEKYSKRIMKLSKLNV